MENESHMINSKKSMKERFFEFSRLSADDYITLWKECIFIVDASFLCGLYRLPIKASEELLSVLEEVSNRIWVPHYAALEFQRNRLLIVAEQKNKFKQVKIVLENTKKHLVMSFQN